MKKNIITFLSLCLIFSLGACGGSNPNEMETSGITSDLSISDSTENPSTLQPAVEPYSYTEQGYGCYGERKKIYGRLFTPDMDNEKLPLVILSHGMNNTHASMKYLAKQLAEKGIMCYIFDFCGGGPNSKSTGDMLDMSPLTECDDLFLVINTMKELENVDTDRIYLCG